MNNKTTIILLAVVAVLVVGIGVLTLGQGGGQPAATTGGTGTAPGGTAPGGTTPGGTDPAAAGPATKLPAKTTPQKWVETYYGAILKGDYKTAWAMQPAGNKAQGDASAFGQTQQTYGMKSFKVTKTSTTPDGQTVVECQQDLGPNGTWVTSWVFKKQGNDVVVASKQTNMAP